jgi:hypothetical protein
MFSMNDPLKVASVAAIEFALLDLVLCALCADSSVINNSVVTSTVQNVTKGRICRSIYM